MTKLLAPLLLLSALMPVGCGPERTATTDDGVPTGTTAFHSPGPEVRFVVPEGYEGPVFVICDPVLAQPLQIDDGPTVFRFDDLGVIRVPEYIDMELSNVMMEAVDQAGQELYVRRGGAASGGELLPLRFWKVSKEQFTDNGLFPGLDAPREYLVERGVQNMTATEKHLALLEASKQLFDNRPPDIIPQMATDTEFYTRFEVPDNFAGPVFLITDPFHGVAASTTDDFDRFSIPESGILRLQVPEEMSMRRSMPKVFEESGKQLWIRPLGRTQGFDTLPIQMLLICRSKTDLPEFQSPAEVSIPQQLNALGVHDLAWPDTDDAAESSVGD